MKDGRERWHFQAKAIIRSGAVVWQDLVLVGSDDHQLYALDRHTGALVWTYITAGPIVATPTVSADRLYFGSTDRCLHAVALARNQEE